MRQSDGQVGEKVQHAPSPFADLTPPYSTIVADPPWSYPEGWPGASTSPSSNMNRGEVPDHAKRRKPLPYASMGIDEIAALPVRDIAAGDACLFLWTTNRYLWSAHEVVWSWGFGMSQVLTWCKTPRGLGPGGAFASTTEFVLYARRGRPVTARTDSTWWHFPRPSNGLHSSKPAAFLDLVEQVSPGPHVELFARAPRLGWDSWGYGYEIGEAS